LRPKRLRCNEDKFSQDESSRLSQEDSDEDTPDTPCLSSDENKLSQAPDDDSNNDVCHLRVSRSRISWSPEEEYWLVSWVQKHVSECSSRRIQWKLCVASINSTPSAFKLFPPSHLTPTAVHEACKRIAKRYFVGVKELSTELLGK
jgi:hypothetical protein